MPIERGKASLDYGDGLNQIATVNGASAAYDPRGNMIADPVTGKAYTYWGSNNRLRTVGSPYTSLSYDALGRLWHVETPGVTNYVSDAGGAGGASDIIAEYDGSGTLQGRYVFDGTGEPLVQYDGTGARTWMIPDERGSIVAQASDSGAMTAINTYDEYGVPGASNAGTFQYTGQMWLSRPGLYNYRARAYAQHLGVFAQTDPIGQAGGPNIYAYVGADPVNGVDPLGLCGGPATEGPNGSIVITAWPVNAPIEMRFIQGLSDAENEITIIGHRLKNWWNRPSPHHWGVDVITQCSAASVFSSLKAPNGSAPGSPAITREGWSRHIQLAGFTSPNPIAQYVNSATFTIVNVTEPGHIFNPGKVTLHVIALAGGGSELSIVGVGSGSHPWRNDAAGYLWFGEEAALIQQGCSSDFSYHGM